MPGVGNNSGFRDITVAESGLMLQQGGLRLNEDEKLLSGHPMDKNAVTVFYCQMGGRSGQAAAFAAANGFAEVYNLQGGITAWAQAGLPITP